MFGGLRADYPETVKVASGLHNAAEGGWQRLATAIIKQACIDYYEVCRLWTKLPKYRDKHNKVKRLTDHDYHVWLVEENRKRQGRKQELLNFFHSDWYLVLSGHPDFELIDRVIKKIEEKRANKYRLFSRDYAKDMDD